MKERTKQNMVKWRRIEKNKTENGEMKERKKEQNRTEWDEGERKKKNKTEHDMKEREKEQNRTEWDEGERKKKNKTEQSEMKERERKRTKQNMMRWKKEKRTKMEQDKIKEASKKTEFGITCCGTVCRSEFLTQFWRHMRTECDGCQGREFHCFGAKNTCPNNSKCTITMLQSQPLLVPLHLMLHIFVICNIPSWT